MLALADKVIAPQSIAIYLSAIAFVSGAARVADNTGEFRVCKLLEGL